MSDQTAMVSGANARSEDDGRDNYRAWPRERGPGILQVTNGKLERG